MATVEQKPAAGSRDGAGQEIAVENPATGEIIRTLPVTSPAEVGEMVARARAAQPAWEALGFEGRGRILRRAQKWILDNSDRVTETIVSETGKTVEDAQLAEIAYAANAFGFWAKHAPSYLADEKVRSANPFVLGRRLLVRYRPLGVVGVIGPWNYPLTNSVGDCIPALAAGNATIVKPSETTPLTALLMAECMAECGLPEGIYQVAPGYGETGEALIDAVDMIMFTGSTATGKKVMAARGADAHAGVARARRQGPDDRPRRRRPRARGQRRRLLLDAERRPDLHLDRARLRRGARLRRVRLKGLREGPRPAPGPPGRRRQRRRRRDDPAPAARDRHPPRRRGPQGRREGARRRACQGGSRATSTSRPCSSTSTTRWRR